MTKITPNENYVHVCEKNPNQECYGIKITLKKIDKKIKKIDLD